ncbi:MAG: EAL domain-containing protein [Mycobacteriales bacterium]|nr:EAL domain-containing protein [Mycobacteriales bacterium]
MHRSPPRQLSAAALTAALDTGGLTVVYQPVVDLRSGYVVAAEALARLRLPDGGVLLPPSAFLPTAERHGLVGRLDAMVADIAIRQAALWWEATGERPFSIGINVSVADLDDSALPLRMQALCAEAGLPLDALVVEVTESLLSVEGRGHEDVLRSLAALGVNVTMDDFGTGFSSLSYLKRFPVKGIKIDRSFTWDLDTDPALTVALVRFGLELGVHVVAEGVETESQLQALCQAGCPFAQGYLFSPPLPAAELTALLDRRFVLPRPVAVPRPRTVTAGLPSPR